MDGILLEESCEILDSRRIPITASNRKEGPYPYYGANGIQDYVDDYIFDDELVLLAEDGGNFGSKKQPIAYRVSGKCWVNNHAHVLKPKDGIDVDYLCYSLMFYNTEKLVNGATRQKLTQAMMRKMLIPKRSISEQKKIVATLNTIRDSIAKQTKRIKLLDNLIKARFVEMFKEKYDLFKVDKKLKTTSGGTPKSSVSEYYDGGDIPWLTSGEVNYGDITKPSNYITEKGLNNSSAKWVPEDSIVIAMYGATAGKVGIVRYKTTTNQAVCSVLPNDNFNQEFLRYAFQDISEELTSKAIGGGQSNISQTIIKNSYIVDAPIEEQERFASFAKQVDKSKFALQNSIKSLMNLWYNINNMFCERTYGEA